MTQKKSSTKAKLPQSRQSVTCHVNPKAMKLVPIQQLQRDFDFQPKKAWPETLAPLAWQNQLISGWQSELTEALVCDGDLAGLLHHCHSDLGISELARLTHKLEAHIDAHFSFETFFAFFGLRQSHRLMKCLSQVLKLSAAAQDWCDEKKLKPNDLEILNSFENLEFFDAVFQRLRQLKASKHQGVEILELSGELQLTKQAQLSLENLPSADEWLRELRRLRYPRREALALGASQKVDVLPWPQKTKAQWKKMGDHDVLEVTFQSTNSTDYFKKIEQLLKLQDKIEEASLWTSTPS
jgi:hypothetical protein